MRWRPVGPHPSWLEAQVTTAHSWLASRSVHAAHLTRQRAEFSGVSRDDQSACGGTVCEHGRMTTFLAIAALAVAVVTAIVQFLQNRRNSIRGAELQERIAVVEEDRRQDELQPRLSLRYVLSSDGEWVQRWPPRHRRRKLRSHRAVGSRVAAATRRPIRSRRAHPG